MPLRTKRWNDPREDSDGYRLLVSRFRPRGVKREAETWDAWCSALGPSPDLHAAAYGKGQEAIPWDEYATRYLREMARQRWFVEGFAKPHREGETITLLCSSACTDAARCHRTLLAALIDEAAFPSSVAAPVRVVRR